MEEYFDPTLVIDMPAKRAMNPNGTFYITEPLQIKLIHSLVSVSKWEARHLQSFIGPRKKTPEQLSDYIRCMSLSPLSDEDLIRLGSKEIAIISAYIDHNGCCTFHYQDENNPKGSGKSTKMFSTEMIREEMYYYGIPVEAERWHFGRLISQIQVCKKREKDRMGGGKTGSKGSNSMKRNGMR